MSETEYFTGKLQQIYTDLPLEEACEKLAKEHNLELGWCDSYKELISNHFYQDGYVTANKKLYKILQINQKEEWDDIFEAELNPDGTLSFIVKYHNGGCCFSEAIEYALRKTK